jgi:hypothetical protein
MTQEDLNQIRAIMREEIASNNETLSAAFRKELAAGLEGLRKEFAAGLDGLRTEFHDRLTAAVVAIRQDFAERMGAAAVSFGTDFSELRKELGHRIDVLDDALGRRMGALEHRMDRIAETTGAIAMEIVSLTRWANRLDRENLETLNTQAAQQRAIDELAKRLRPPEQPSI